ncbi:MAG TPA: YkvA family protein [Jiangellaceae bacterium]
MSGETWVWIAVAVLVVGVVTLAAAIWFARRLIVTRRALGQLGFNEKFAFYGALAYMIFPVDVLPDPIYLDDMGVLAAALFYLTKALQERKGREVPDRLPADR